MNLPTPEMIQQAVRGANEDQKKLMENYNLDKTMEDRAKELIGNWGYEEPYWWQPIKQALIEAHEEGRKAGVREAIEQPNENSCHYKGVCEHCAVEEFKSSLTKLL